MFGFKRNNLADSSVNNDMLSKQRRYDSLVRALHADLFRYAYWLCGDKHIAEDITQETFLRAWRSLESLKDDKAAKAWLITILRRENARRFERKQFDYSDVEQSELADNVSLSTEDNMEQYLVRRQIARLEIEYREPLILQVIGGFSGEEIADILQLNRNTVMTRLFRARNQLKELLDQEHTRGRSNG
ncbi:sigma-70 family RNA polymerase sigma factor [Shewanella colwelliana]|uniref:RNA polymerase sigma factor n=1 Tax=Shewanella colwelliana TaxID=23 RepID=A0A1E5IXT6_SHECO|nr:sigma-70 family RNA polymerase sigma factor [Shewanella colwelliana]MCZ4338753.1 sigma-70 family RNA polymerase sigma factor [Shewanella colwelliana]MDX1282162.1 sigma-70 family RNA polymerase sigma factor [Shewanella colwelliana]OEG75294.1 RNA polymerase subunit sigma [Shewanella colwelliana]GIU26347.1 RNA polymerase sigma factor [Shewanella colwelliana]GIU36429.1 RNA polymerase sigma factor [Shewanella colwelliana]